MSDGSPPEPSRTPRPAGDGRSARGRTPARLRYLRAAAELAAQQRPGQDTSPYAVSRVTMADIAAELGVARTTMYKQWSSKLEFWADLTTYIASTATGPTPDDAATSLLGDGGAPLAAGDDGAPAACSTACKPAKSRTRGSHCAPPCSATRGTSGSSRWSPRRIAGRSTRSRSRSSASSTLSRRARGEPLTARDIAVTGFCIGAGLATAGRLSPRVTREDIAIDDESGGWGMLAFALRGIIRRCTRPRADTDPPSSARTAAQERTAFAQPEARWTEAQRVALGAGARRFVSGEPSAASRRPPSALGHVTLARLPRHAGVSRQSLHRVWPNQQAFAVDLVTFLFEERCEQVLLTMRQSLRRSMEVSVGGSLVATEHALTTLAEQASRGPLTHLIYASHEDDPAVRADCCQALESLLDRFAADLEALTPSWGGSTREGVTFFHLGAIISLTELSAARLERTKSRLRPPRAAVLRR